MTALTLQDEHSIDTALVTAPWVEGEIPQVDTLRNHSWKQSGLLYADRLDASGDLPAAAYLMWGWGDRLFDRVNLPPPRTRGVFAVDDRRRRTLLEAANRLGIGSEVNQLSQSEAREYAGDFFKPEHSHILVPDCPFDESNLLSTARKQAIQAGVQFFQGEVNLARDEKGNFFARIHGQVIHPRLLVLCAGAGTIKLLDQVGVQHTLQVRSSGLIRIHGCDDAMRAPLFADRCLNLSVVRHAPAPVTPDGCLVVGSGHAWPVQRLDGSRIITQSQKSEIVDLLPHTLRVKAIHAPATLGYKTELASGPTHRIVDPVVELVSPNLIWAVPGKVTLAYYAADRVSHQAKKLLGRGRKHSPKSLAGLLPPWNAPLDLHHTVRFSAVDESEKLN
jgi:hypothetical protein